jgi:hypothetical protein
MKKGVVLVTVLVLMLLPSVLFAQGSGKSMVSCKETMECSEEQCAKLMELRTEHQMASIKLGADLQILELKLCQELSKDDPSARELESLVSKIGAVREELQKKRIDQLLQAKKILEPEQWKAYRRCFGSMGDPCSTGMDCKEIDRCGTMGGSPMRMVLSGAGHGPVKCISMDKDCASLCSGKMMGRSCCEAAMEGMQDCGPGKGSCQTIERRCIQIETEE